MSRQIKFKYIWSNPEKTNFITEIFTLDEIEAGNQFMVLENEPLLKDYKLIARVQFTGLLDKNRKEIFEGDILFHKYYSKLVICGFVDGSFIFEDVSKYDKSLEIVGNLYKDPELLGGEND